MLIGFPCLFHWLTGLYCPGCGGTRAALHLLHGDIAGSLRYHPLVLYLAVVILVQLAGWALAKARHDKKYLVGHLNLLSYIGLGIVLVNCFYKNYMLIAMGIDLLP